MEPGNPQHETAATGWKALAPSIPVVMGYLPIGFTFGVLAVKAGVPPLPAMLMPLIVFAGSAQLVAVGMIAQGTHPWALVFTTFMINLRHLLMSASLSPYMRGWRKGEVARFAFELTDETFGVHSLRFERGETAPRSALQINAVCHTAWILGSALGVAAGGMIGDVRPWGLDYALPAMFIALLVFQLRGSAYLVTALASAALSLFAWAAGLTQWNVIIAGVLGAGIGAGVETWQKRH